MFEGETEINRQSTEDPFCNPRSIYSSGSKFMLSAGGKVVWVEGGRESEQSTLWIQGKPVKQGGRFVFYRKRLARPDSVIETLPNGAVITHRLAALG